MTLLNGYGFREYGVGFVRNIKEKRLERVNEFQEIRAGIERILGAIVD